MTSAAEPAAEQEQEIVEKKTHKFPCKGCGAELLFNAKADKLVCEYCGFEETIPKSQEEIKEYSFNEYFAKPKATGLGTDNKTFKCNGCGATTSVSAQTISTECAFCGSKHVFEREAMSNMIRPESLVPFDVDKKVAVEKFRTWLAGKWFRPNDLKKKAQLDGIDGMYLPYWTYDAFTTSWWEAERGDYYYVTEWVLEKDSEGREREVEKQVRKTRWTWVRGNHQQFFDDELVCASGGVDHRFARSIHPFDTAQLVVYDPNYLSGWAAEEYHTNLEDAWQVAKSSMEGEIRSACKRRVGGDTQRGLRVDTAFSNITYKHVLLPVWVAGYRYGDKVYQFLVNGQTGKVNGQAPLSWFKIMGLILVIVAVIAVIAYFNRA